MTTSFSSIDALQHALVGANYVADRPLATALFLALKLQKPLLLEGEAGVGKTEIAKTLAALQARRLIRLQCYEGLDVNTTIYEWNYTRQMLQIRLIEAQGGAAGEAALSEIFGPEFLIKRPLLQGPDRLATLRAMREARDPLYRDVAARVIEVDGVSLQQALRYLLDAVSTPGGAGASR